MSSRTTRLLTALDGTDAADLAGPLAQLPVAEVDRIVRALRAARSAGRKDEQDLRRRRHHDKKAFGSSDDSEIAQTAARMARSLAKRAALTLETLAQLKAHYDSGPQMLALAVAGARAQGYSDAEIGKALGVTGSAVGERYGRRNPVHPETQAAS